MLLFLPRNLRVLLFLLFIIATICFMFTAVIHRITLVSKFKYQIVKKGFFSDPEPEFDSTAIEYATVHNITYAISTNKTNWFIAQAICHNNQMFGAFFFNKYEIEALTEYLITIGRDRDDFWTSGNNLGQPDMTSSGCAQLWASHHLLDDTDCHSEQYYICRQ